MLAEVSDCAWAQKSQEDSKENQYLPNRLEEWADVTAITSLDLSTMVEEPCPACGDKVSSSVSSFVSPTRSTYSSTLGATSPLLSSVNTPCTPTGEVWSARIIATPVKVVQEDLPMVCIGEVSSHYVDWCCAVCSLAVFSLALSMSRCLWLYKNKKRRNDLLVAALSLQLSTYNTVSSF